MSNRLLRAAAGLVAAGALGIAGWATATGWTPPKQKYPLQGVDLAANPAPADWGTVRAQGADFAYLVATTGDQRDPAFEANWAALPDAGMRRGAVHLYSLCEPGPAQANAFNTFVPRNDDALPVAVDVSFHDDCDARPDREVLIGDLARFIAMIEAHTGKPVLLRVSRAVERHYSLTAALNRPVWAVSDLIAPSYTARPWRLWRASSFRRVDGIDGPVNWDVAAP